MHVYIYDYFVTQAKYSRLTAKLETRITDLGLNGKICRVGLMQSIGSVIENEIDRGVKTIIIVGNDSSIHKALNYVADKKIPLGIIPVGDNNYLANALGIKNTDSACDILASRRIESIDLGLANNNHFLNKASINTSGTTIENEAGYSIEIGGQGSINIVNLPISSDDISKINSFPNDDKLELVINIKEKGIFSKNNEQTILPFNRINLLNKQSPVTLDSCATINCPVQILLSNKKINVIVGKERNF